MGEPPSEMFEILVGGGVGDGVVEGGFESGVGGVEVEATFFAVGVEGGVGTVG